MKTIKVSEATNIQLDWLVALCEETLCHWVAPNAERGTTKWIRVPQTRRYTTNVAQMWPIIEREKLCIGYKHQADPAYCSLNDPATNCWARTTGGGYLSCGHTTLIAAARCYVASKLGAEVEVPEELS